MKTYRLSGRYLLRYTIYFCLFMVGAFWVFWKTGKNFVWNQDGYTQYLPYLEYMGKYLREFVGRAIHGDFTIKMFDFTIGYGDDVGSVVRAHPLDFLSIFVPGAYTEVLYMALIVLRIYLSGLAFSLFGRYWALTEEQLLPAAFIYMFCGQIMLQGILHPTMISTFIILPLLLLTAERFMRREGFLAFSLVVFLGFMSNYYLMYMCAIVLAGYVLLRFPAVYREERLRNFFRLFVRMMGAFLLGMAMSMATLMPIIHSLGTSARLAGEGQVENLWLYADTKRYYRWLLELIAPMQTLKNNTYLHFAAPVLLAVVLLYRERKAHRELKWALLLELLVLLVPFGAYAFAGFTNVTNRWMFLLAMTLAMTFAVMWPRMIALRRADIGCFVVLLAVYGGVAWYDEHHIGIYAQCGMLMLAVSIVFFALLGRVRMQQRLLSHLSTLLILFCVCINGYMLYDAQYGGVVEEFYDQWVSREGILASPLSRFTQVDDDTFYRVDSDLVLSNMENYSLPLGYRSTAQYNSVLNAAITHNLLELDSVGIGAIHRFQHLDARAGMEALANVGYYLTYTANPGHVPYGFVRVDDLSDAEYTLYRNMRALPFGYSYDQYMTREEYLALDPASREQAQLQAAVVEEAPEGIDRAGDLAIAGETVELQLPDAAKGQKRTATGYRAKKDNTQICLPYARRAGYTAYLQLEGFTVNQTYSFVDVNTADSHSLMILRGLGKMYSLNRTNYLVNLGYAAEDGMDQVYLTLTKKGRYDLAAARIIYRPMEEYEQAIAKRSEEGMTDTVFGLNTVSGRGANTAQKIYVFSIPYSTGWSAYVDGEKQALMSVNTAWLGLDLAPGEHSIELRYVTPGAITGRIIAAIGWLVFIMLGALQKIWYTKRKRQ